MRAIGILGGTFDPVHIGHLRLALEIQAAAGLDQIQLVPLSTPAHRAPTVLAAETRLQMLQAAIAGQPGLSVNPLELERAGISYTCETLIHLREQDPDSALCLITGMDSFATFNQWHRWREIPTLAHIIVAQRPGRQTDLSPELQEFLAQRQTAKIPNLHEQQAGSVVMLDIPALDISSTRIRAMLKTGLSTRYLLPEPVQEIIESNDYYATRAND
jgi:nicotinate-nucleotide adenylyltransferase